MHAPDNFATIIPTQKCVSSTQPSFPPPLNFVKINARWFGIRKYIPTPSPQSTWKYDCPEWLIHESGDFPPPKVSYRSLLLAKEDFESAAQGPFTHRLIPGSYPPNGTIVFFLGPLNMTYHSFPFDSRNLKYLIGISSRFIALSPLPVSADHRNHHNLISLLSKTPPRKNSASEKSQWDGWTMLGE